MRGCAAFGSGFLFLVITFLSCFSKHHKNNVVQGCQQCHQRSQGVSRKPHVKGGSDNLKLVNTHHAPPGERGGCATKSPSRRPSPQWLRVLLQQGFSTLVDTFDVWGWIFPGHRRTSLPLPVRCQEDPFPRCENQRCRQTSWPQDPCGGGAGRKITPNSELLKICFFVKRGTIDHFSKLKYRKHLHVHVCVCACASVFTLRNDVFPSKTQESYIKSQGNFLLSLKHLERKDHYEFQSKELKSLSSSKVVSFYLRCYIENRS